MLNNMSENEQIADETWIELLKRAYESTYNGESKTIDVQRALVDSCYWRQKSKEN